MYNTGAYHDIIYSEQNLNTFTIWIDKNHPEITKNFHKVNELYSPNDVKSMIDILSNVEKFQLRGFIAKSNSDFSTLPKTTLSSNMN